MSVSNAEIAQLFENMAALLEMKGDTIFKIRAYQRVARTIDHLSFSLEQAVHEGMDLRQIPGVGKAINEKIHELLQTGRVAAYETLLAELPDGVLTLLTIPGVGPKTAMRLAQELGVSTIEGVERAIQEGRLTAFPRMNEKMAENILRHIHSLRTRDQRIPIGQALPLAEEIIATLREKCPTIGQLGPAGSLRRWEETVVDIDLIGTSPHPQQVIDTLVSLPQVQQVLDHGPQKARVVVDSSIQVELRLGEAESFGTLLQHFTGSQQHNIQLGDHAHRLGLSLNEYGITHLDSGVVEKFADEESFYARLGLQYIPPELRLGMGELGPAQNGQLPRLVEESDLCGDLHLHSLWSDGRDSIETMVEAAVARGYEYLALTDHSAGRGIANGLSPERLLEQISLLRSLQSRYPITILCGSEVDIRADGTLDYPDELLAQLDLVVASVHSAMGQDSATMTQRIIQAMRHPAVTIIGHPSTRLLGRREPVQFDLEALLQAARETGTAMEVNASPERLDLKDTHAYQARELGVPLVISSDSHHHAHLAKMRFGVAVARRAWCGPRHIVNAFHREQFLAFIRTPKPERTRVFDAQIRAETPRSRP
jgi:DNA polymerase (family 10)